MRTNLNQTLNTQFPSIPNPYGTGLGNPGSNTYEIEVIDGPTGLPIPNANVYLKSNPSIGTITDARGFAKITASPGDVVIISHVGYNTIERKIEDLGSLQSLNPDRTELSEANLGTISKKNWWLIPVGVAAVFIIASIASGGNTGKTGLNGGKKRGKKKGKKKPKKLSV